MAPTGPTNEPELELRELPEWAWNVLVIGAYTPVAVGAVLWIAWSDGAGHLVDRLLGPSPIRGLALGAAAGTGVVILTRLAGRVSSVAARMERSLAATIGPVSTATCAVVALFSALGEELLFRGVLQPNLGVAATSLLFGAVHVPVERDLLPWPVFAFGAGLLFGLLEVAEGLPAPVAAHFLVNFLNLRWLARASASRGSST